MTASGLGAGVGSAAIVGQTGGNGRLFGGGEVESGSGEGVGGWNECVCATSGCGGKDDDGPVRRSSLPLLWKDGKAYLWGGLLL